LINEIIHFLGTLIPVDDEEDFRKLVQATRKHITSNPIKPKGRVTVPYDFKKFIKKSEFPFGDIASIVPTVPSPF